MTKNIMRCIICNRIIDFRQFEKTHGHRPQKDNSIRSRVTALSKRLMALLNGKGYFCYDYVTSRNVLRETSLPPLEMFRNQLDRKKPDEGRYGEAMEIWNLLQCRNIDDYNCIYNVMDTINLAVMMEERTKTLNGYLHLDPRHFYIDERIWCCLRQVQDTLYCRVHAK